MVDVAPTATRPPSGHVYRVRRDTLGLVLTRRTASRLQPSCAGGGGHAHLMLTSRDAVEDRGRDSTRGRMTISQPFKFDELTGPDPGTATGGEGAERSRARMVPSAR